MSPYYIPHTTLGTKYTNEEIEPWVENVSSDWCKVWLYHVFVTYVILGNNNSNDD